MKCRKKHGLKIIVRARLKIMERMKILKRKESCAMNEQLIFFVGGYSHEELQDNLNALYKHGYDIIHISSIEYQDRPYFTVVAQFRGILRA